MKEEKVQVHDIHLQNLTYLVKIWEYFKLAFIVLCGNPLPLAYFSSATGIKFIKFIINQEFGGSRGLNFRKTFI